MPCADIFPQSGNEDRDGIVAAPFQGAEYAHQPRLRLRAALAVGAVNNLEDQHCQLDLALALVVGRGYLRMAQKRKELISVFLQPQGQAARIGVGVVPQRQIQQAPVQPLDA